jgi:hypothetical protein
MAVLLLHTAQHRFGIGSGLALQLSRRLAEIDRALHPAQLVGSLHILIDEHLLLRRFGHLLHARRVLRVMAAGDEQNAEDRNNCERPNVTPHNVKPSFSGIRERCYVLGLFTGK